MKLEDINKDKPFKVPDQYFEEFPERLMDRIRKESEKDRGKVNRGRMISLPAMIKMAVAASILALITFGIYQINFEGRSPDQLLAEVPTESLIAYLEESELSVDELIETIDMELIIEEDPLMEPYLLPENEIDEKMIEDIMIDYELEFRM
jgi:hypothetical protein